jgi:hypothetical protein
MPYFLRLLDTYQPAPLPGEVWSDEETDDGWFGASYSLSSFLKYC